MEKETLFPNWKNLRLTEAEQQVLITDDKSIAEMEEELKNALVCKILTSKMVNVEAFRSTMPKLWDLKENVTIYNMTWNIYLCKFKTPQAKQWVLQNSPWSFHKCLLVFEHSLKGTFTIQDLEFQYASFWIHFHLLPLTCFSRKMAEALGNVVGSFEMVETNEEGMCCWGRTMKVRVRIDVKKPLRRVVKLKLGFMGMETLIPLTYEKLPDFCYGCGKLGHVLDECHSHSETAEEDLQYGDWLRGMRLKMGGDNMFREKEEGWEEDTKGGDSQNSMLLESVPESRSDGEEKIWEEYVGGVISGENKEGDEKMKDSARKAGENGEGADQQIKKNDEGKMIWAEQRSLDQMETIGTRRVSMGQLRKFEWRSRGPAKEGKA